MSRAAQRSRSLVLVPPEGVPLHLSIPTLGARIGAQIIDLIITGLLTAALVYALVFVEVIPGEAVVALTSLVSLLAGTPLYILFELLMNGRTPGKRLLGIRVVSLDGTGLTTHQVVVRNLLKEVEVLVPIQVLPAVFVGSPLAFVVLAWTIAVVVVVWRSRAHQRIGDFAANTVVVEQPSAELQPDLAMVSETAAEEAVVETAERYVFTTGQLDLYGAYELQVLEKLLRTKTPAPGEPPSQALLDVTASIRRKIEYPDPVPDAEAADFLLAFYRAQRAFLEQKKLFGEARDDKFHRDAAAGEAAGAPIRPGAATDPVISNADKERQR
ncbi:RDD family protein [Mangrovicella endophytica]|uniref:RDD family protein n=1 Tax=Mangrovicella endophytica TaxID=2066697 RepID=UPI0013000A2A|nr:RDD family protein [Mangrovicella endophytica]